jgi:hypothetical protein
MISVLDQCVLLRRNVTFRKWWLIFLRVYPIPTSLCKFVLIPSSNQLRSMKFTRRSYSVLPLEI